MQITPDDIQKVANLARLEVKPAEVDSMTEQIGKILNYFDKLNKLDTKGIAPTTHAISINNAFREDEIQESLSQEDALKNGPQQNGEAFVVPKII